MSSRLVHALSLAVVSEGRPPRLGPPRPTAREVKAARVQVLAAWGARERDAANAVLGAAVRWAALEGCGDSEPVRDSREELRRAVSALLDVRTRFHADVSGLERLLAACQRRRRP